MRNFTSVYWLGNRVQIERFDAATDRAAYQQHDEMGWNAYDDRTLLAGHVATAEIEGIAADAVVTELGTNPDAGKPSLSEIEEQAGRLG
jgi:hypothetical protein